MEKTAIEKLIEIVEQGFANNKELWDIWKELVIDIEKRQIVKAYSKGYKAGEEGEEPQPEHYYSILYNKK
jgi:hypothetical protein